jgi:hypothetical protein
VVRHGATRAVGEKLGLYTDDFWTRVITTHASPEVVYVKVTMAPLPKLTSKVQLELAEGIKEAFSEGALKDVGLQVWVQVEELPDGFAFVRPKGLPPNPHE